MRDNVILRANVFRPATGGPWPVLVSRQPYSKDDQLGNSYWLEPTQAARHGFIVVVQDVRGRFASGGAWSPFENERNDGYDTVEWAARLPGSNGRVGMFGCSYLGSAQWLAALEHPPSLAAIAPAATWSEPKDGLLARGGALELGLGMAWTLVTGAAHIARTADPDELEQRLDALLDDYDALPTCGWWTLPVDKIDTAERHGAPHLGTLRTAGDHDAAGLSRVAGNYEQVTVPSLHIGGWHDLFLQGTLDNYVAMTDLGRPTRLIVGPWAHDISELSDPIGDVSFGIRAGATGTPIDAEGDVSAIQLAWFQRHLTEARSEETSPGAPVRIFVMGRNRWRSEDRWPLARAHPQPWFLTGGGVLQPDGAQFGDQSTEFVYNPGDPVPTIGGNTSELPEHPSGPHDQRSIEKRRDVCVFSSDVLQHDLEVTGRVIAMLSVASSAPSTDWVARLCDVDLGGRSINICDGIIRVTTDADRCKRVKVDLWSTSNVFLAGHRLRVHVTSSSFPRWDRNLNTGQQGQAHFELARQVVYHNAQYPSYIELPVVR